MDKSIQIQINCGQDKVKLNSKTYPTDLNPKNGKLINEIYFRLFNTIGKRSFRKPYFKGIPYPIVKPYKTKLHGKVNLLMCKGFVIQGLSVFNFILFLY